MDKFIESTDVDALPPLRFIPFERFREVGSFPRFPDNSNVCVDLDDIDVENSLLIFISHCWLRGWSGAEGWDGRAHPDNATGGKYELCVDGIEQIMKIYAPGFGKCHVWCDYGCIDQSGNPAGELKQLNKIVGVCDCLLTPVYDADHATQSSTNSFTSVFKVDQSAAWTGTPHSYLNRGWCRVEMFYGANIPLVEDNESRQLKMRAGLLLQRKRGNRPHFWYGSKFKAERRAPQLLPPLQNSFFEEFHPVKGNLAVASDKEKIIQLVKDLEPYMRKAVVGLAFDDDSDSDAVIRKGKCTYPDGGMYTGEFINNKRHGFGKHEDVDCKYTYPDGGMYTGEFINYRRHGYGKYDDVDCSIYEGLYSNGKRHGRGKLIFPDGGVYDGQFVDNDIRGQGSLRQVDGNVYEGQFIGGKMNGHGKFLWADGCVHEGEYLNGQKNGHGIYTHTNGDVFIGNYKDDTRDGRGRSTDSNGNVFEGEWKGNQPHIGVYMYSNGRITCREYDGGMLVSEKLWYTVRL
jgi:hypothetical protein